MGSDEFGQTLELEQFFKYLSSTSQEKGAAFIIQKDQSRNTDSPFKE